MAARRRRTRKQEERRLGPWAAAAVLLLACAYVGVLEMSSPHVDGDRLRFDTFLALVDSGNVKSARILDVDSFLVGRYTRADGTSVAYNTPYLKESRQPLIDVLVAKRIPIEIEQQNGKRLVSLASYLLPSLILVVLFIYMIISFRSGSGLFRVRSGAKRILPDHATATFADVAGQDAAVAELREIKDFLSDPARFVALGASVPKGVLLFGPPGCGKTLLARALAGEAGATFWSISGSDFVEMYVGIGAARVRDLFDEARQHAPALIFIDELDSIGRSRATGGVVAVHGEQEQTLNQILAEMDGFSPSEGLIVLAATNRPDVLDPALLRPGRFDRSVGLELPGEADRLAILRVHARAKVMAPEVDLRGLASRAIGMTGADLANVLNESALLAARAGKAVIGQAELDEALQRVLDAPERQRRLAMRQRSIAKRSSTTDRVTFADVAGVDDAIAELAEIQSYLADPGTYAAMGAQPPRGILLSGPPGCGKTLLARAVAGEANAAFFSVSGSEFVEIFVGQGAARVRELFAEARSVAPSIVFIDELDAIGASRGQSLEGHGERDQTLNQILVELDGFNARSAVIVMAATNRPDILDSALVRPGRFDREVEVSLPDRAGRRAILAVHARTKRMAPDVDLDVVAALTQGFSGADLAGVLNEAALLAARQGHPSISRALIDESIDRVSLGIASRGTLLSAYERRLVGYHEAGHALVAITLFGASSLHKITVVPRARALAHCRMIDDADRSVFSRDRLVNRMAVFLGGREAEELVYGQPSSGAGGDIEQVGVIARRMVCELGMSEAVGAIPFIEGRGQRRWSEQTARLIDAEVRALVDEAAARARDVLTSRAEDLDRLVTALLEHETLSAQQAAAIIGTDDGVLQEVPPAT